MKLGFGQHGDKPLASVPAPYLFWICSSAGLRRYRPGAVALALGEILRRPHAELAAELASDPQPAIDKNLGIRRQRQAANLDALEERREAERAARMEAAQQQAQRDAEAQAAQARLNALLAEKARRQAQPDDWCDLV